MSNNQSWMKRRFAAVAQGVGQSHPIFVATAENSTVVDVEGKSYLDFAGGISVLNTGHLHPKVVAAVKQQLDKFSHTCFQVLAYEPYVVLCEKMNALAPGEGVKKTLLVNSGSEAVENAIKIARAHTKRHGVIAFTGAYHGRTMATLALTGKVQPYASGMGIMPGSVFRATYPCVSKGIRVEDALQSIAQIFAQDAEPCDIAAIIIEPVLGEGGFHVAPPAFMKALRSLCDQHGMVLICDEVQSGAGRTGTFFASEQLGAVPDLTTFAKSIAGGFPLAGVVGHQEIMDAVKPGGLGGTYAGSPIACAAALAVLEVFEEENLLERAHSIGQTIHKHLLQMQKNIPAISDVRGLGAMCAFELCEAKNHQQPDPSLTKALINKARDLGLILLSCGENANVVRLMVPLTVPEKELLQGLNIIEKALCELIQ